nr:hypothetical protein [Actinomycetota bacterium]
VFYVSRGPGGYAVQLGSADERARAPIFDSRELKGEDLFAATLIRPGTYALRNAATGAEGEIAVAYPKPGRGRSAALQPKSIECTEEAFKPASIRIRAAQGQLYRCRVPSRIQIELLEPDDGPIAKRRSRR